MRRLKARWCQASLQRQLDTSSAARFLEARFLTGLGGASTAPSAEAWALAFFLRGCLGALGSAGALAALGCVPLYPCRHNMQHLACS